MRNRETDKHHMLFGRRSWTNESHVHRDARQHPGFMYKGINRQWHDVLHRVVNAVPIPGEQVAYDLLQIGEDTMKIDQSERVDHQLDIMAGYMKGNKVEQRAAEMGLIMGSLAAQQGVISLAESMRPRYE